MSLKEEILQMLSGLDVFIPRLGESKYEHMKRIRRGSMYVSLYRMEKEGLVKKKKVNKFIAFEITVKGKEFLKKTAPLERRSDGLSTVVIFDIPESNKRARKLFRSYLLKNGFINLQKSVFISPNKFNNELKQVIIELGIKNYVSILSSKIEYVL